MDGTCKNQKLRDSGCFVCSKGKNGDEKCVSCIEDHILFYGTCVTCLPNEECSFNNSADVECVDHDFSHCGTRGTGCKDHKCKRVSLTVILLSVSLSAAVIGLVILAIFMRIKIKNIKKQYEYLSIPSFDPSERRPQ